MTKEETLIVERLKRTFENVEELEKAFDLVADQLVNREQQLRDCKALCTRAADALDKYGLSDDQKDLIAELRKAAE
jgi:hypothetical protein